jgi:hypothetical protein
VTERLVKLATISRLRAFRACPRYHHLTYNEQWEAIDDVAVEANFGTAGHRVLELWWSLVGGPMPTGVQEPIDGQDVLDRCLAMVDDDPRIAELVDPYRRAALAALVTGYHVRWWEASQVYEVIAVEQEFRAPLCNPATGRPTKEWQEAGKMDVVVRDRRDGLVYVIEHKFSGEDVSPGSAYWRRLRVDGQVSIYLDGARRLGHDVAGCIYDVIAKPGQRPLKATPKPWPLTKGKGCKACGGSAGGKAGIVQGSGGVAADGGLVACEPCAGTGWSEAPRPYADVRPEDETPAEYGQRVADAIAADPLGYFGRGDVVRFDEEAEDARHDVYDTTLAIREALRTGRHFRNTEVCTRLFGRVCPFLPVCSKETTLDDQAKYRRRDTAHPELPSAGQG